MSNNFVSLEGLIELFLAKAQALNLMVPRDRVYFRNQLYLRLNLTWPELVPAITPDLIQGTQEAPSSIIAYSLAELASMIYAELNETQRALLGATSELAESALINILLPAPSSIEQQVKDLWQSAGAKPALDWFYQFSQNTNYIKTADIAKNQSWASDTQYGKLEITINLSKPEKDPLEIARAKLLKSTNSRYPKCLLCIENEGYSGSFNQPARHSHRLLSLQLNQQEWFFQYSPYAYYPEHSIVLNLQHRDMVIDRDSFVSLFDFVDLVPHYLIGSNSDIPIVGGSILTHDHYQAGNYVFPIEKAQIKHSYQLKSYPTLEVNYLLWPVTTLQLIGSRQQLLELILLIQQKWYAYSNFELGIVNASDAGLRHNALTPVVRKLADERYVAYLMLRNNLTSSEHPEGIFHPHQALHHIKKENIGLIEAMGVAILPGRLKTELAAIEQLLLLNDLEQAQLKLAQQESLSKHQVWLTQLYAKYGTFSGDSLQQLLRDEVAAKFAQVLECSGVFKHNSISDIALGEFVQTLEVS